MDVTGRMSQALLIAGPKSIHCFVLSHWDMQELERRATEWPTNPDLSLSGTQRFYQGVPLSSNASALPTMSFAVVTTPYSDYPEIHSI